MVQAVPKESAYRAKNREQLRAIGSTGGLRALLEALNWEDYLLLADRFADQVRWVGDALSSKERVAKLRTTVKEIVHPIRHNNDHELQQLITQRGYDAVQAELVSLLGMVAE